MENTNMENTNAERRTKTNDIISHLKTKGSITSMEAFNLYGATRLSAIIFDVKRRYGMNIVSDNESCSDRYGHTCHYARYRLIKE